MELSDIFRVRNCSSNDSLGSLFRDLKVYYTTQNAERQKYIRIKTDKNAKNLLFKRLGFIFIFIVHAGS